MNAIKKTGRIGWKGLFLAFGVLAGAACTVHAQTAADDKEVQTETSEIKNAPAFPAFFSDEVYTDSPIVDMKDAEKVAAEIAGKISGDEQTSFEPWRSFTDSRGNHFYVFRQMVGDVTVSGGAVKVVTDAGGKMLGIVSSVETELPDLQAKEGILPSEAEKVVTKYLEDTGHADECLLEGHTQKVILPVNLELDPYSEEEKEEVRFVWAVYTLNDGGSITGSSELPYLAHYVGMDGEYLYSLPTIIPEDEAGKSGFPSSYVFEFMEPAEYTGMVTLSDGSQQEITVPVMRDARTGMYYLGDLQRRIAVADCYEFLYNNGHVVLEASPDNTGWDDTCLLSVYNYGKAWDYYDAIGWKGGDGLGTPILILKDFCDKDHEPIDNAAYAGSYYGWQLFLSSSANDFSQCLDVLAHEFTHCVTGSVMTYNAYSNDYGAINEAISDIQGNLCEMMMGATRDRSWALGENGKEEVRSMSDPHEHMQPEYAWDLFYRPNVKVPTDSNDRGGVHSNSSLLNRIAYLLCAEGGMTYEEARDFWFSVDCSMVPGTDYGQLSELMPWVLKNTGLEKYLPVLKDAISRTGISGKQLPASFAEDRALVTLTLPETGSFADGNWSLYILSIDPEAVKERIRMVWEKEGEYAAALPELDELLQDAVRKYLFEDAGTEAFKEVISSWIPKYFSGILFLNNSAAGADGRTIQVVTTPGYTIPVMLYLKFSPAKNVPEGFGLAAYTKDRWFDLVKIVLDAAEDTDKTVDELVSLIAGEENYLFTIRGAAQCEIPAEGLEELRTFDGKMITDFMSSGESEEAVTEQQ